jgi:lambda family phage minor tail protein L
MTINADLQLLYAGKLVELFVLDVTPLGGTVFRFHAGTNELKANVVWQGNTYSRFPMRASGFDFSARGTLPRPELAMSNILGAMSAMIIDYEDLVGAAVTRKRTFVKYLDAVNFSGGTNPTADPNAGLPDDVYYIARKKSEDNEFVELELAAAIDVTGVMLPNRVMAPNVCMWQYRVNNEASACTYTGGAVAKADDTPTAVLGEDRCGKRLTSCRLRFPLPANLPYGGFPGVGQYRF